MSKQLFDQLNDAVEQRAWHKEQNDMDVMADIYEGNLPPEYDRLFPKNTPKHLVQVIPLAWDDLATQVGRLPDLRGEPVDLSAKELKAAGKLEKIGFSYLSNAKPTGKRFMKDLAWWLQLGRTVAIVTPDMKDKRPRLQIRDARTCYPGVAEMVNNTIVELDDLIFKYKMKRSEAVSRGLADPLKEREIDTEITVLEYLDKNSWVIISEAGKVVSAQHNLGVVPGWVFQSFTPNAKAGKSRFKEQIGLMVAMSRLITAKVAFADRLVHPILWAKGHEANIEIGPYTINKLGPQGEMGQINPPTMLQVDQDIQMLNSFSRILNRNPEVRQGEIAAKGSYTSAKTLEQLSEAIDTVVGADWDILAPGLERLLAICYEMDMKLWPNEEKTISGFMKGKRFVETYIPKNDIGDRRRIRVDYGFGVGGYQGFLMHLQAKDAGTMSLRRAMEAMPGVTDVNEEMRTIELEGIDQAGMAMFQQLAAAGQLDLRIWAKVRDVMSKKGEPLHKAILKYEDMLASQAQAAQGTDTASFTTPEEAGPPQEEQLPGLPPSALAGV
jgi:hypothetical protein